METVTLTLTGKSLGDLAAQAIAFGTTAQEGVKIGKTSTTPPKTKKAAPVEEPEEIDADELSDELEAAEETTDDADEMGFDEEAEQEAPKKSAKAKTAKLTEKDVNTAALAHARKHTRPKTLALLKSKFKVSSISELKPEQYSKVIEALKV